MPIELLKKDEQEDGEFNGGAILEKRPVLFSAGSRSFNPYSNLFYWAHAWSKDGSLLGQHPHQGFDIISIILEGEIEHYDTHNKQWKKLSKGSAQIIRAGNGISHAERFFPGSAIFQIWFDPDLSKSLGLPAEYDDYSPEAFRKIELEKQRIKVYKDEDGPIKMNTKEVRIIETEYESGKHDLQLKKDKVYSNFVLGGSLSAKEYKINSEDFFVIKEEENIEIEVTEHAKIFSIETPLKLDYETYTDRFA